MSLLTKILFCMVLIFSAAMVAAHEEATFYNQVHLQTEVERDITNDEMQCLLVSEHQGKLPGELARIVNLDVKWALDIVRKNKAIEISTRAYQTVPVYQDSDIVAWRVNQEILLKSRDMAALSQLIGELQEKLQVRQMQFSASQQSREETANELIDEALQAFKSRVALISRHMDGKDYRIVNLHINSNGHQPVLMRAEGVQRQAMAMSSAPEVAAGTSRVSVNVSGSVQFF